MRLLVPGLGEDDPLPLPFEHDRFLAFCLDVWDAAADAPGLACTGAVAGGHAVADVVAARVDHLSPVGAPDEGQRGRLAVASSVEIEGGRTWAGSLVFEDTLGPVSMAREDGGWGLQPWEVHPGGGSFARQLLAGWVLKISTDRSGVPVQPVDHNRCLSWGPARPDGSSTCLEMGPWTFTALDDGPIVWLDQAAGAIYPFPLVTLISTGLPDPELPGGVLIQTLGSTALEALDGCAWPGAFEPDRVRLLDTAPAATDEPYATFDGQTWRFGREGPDAVLALATSHRRGFCPAPLAR